MEGFQLSLDLVEDPVIKQNRAKYMRARAKRMIARLRQSVFAHNPALSVSETINPDSQLVRIHLTLGTARLETRHVATIDGHVDIRWGFDEHGRGKALNYSGYSYVADGEKQYFGPLDFRSYRDTAQTLFQRLQEQGLPKRKRGQVAAAWKEAQGTTYRPRGADPEAKTRTRNRRKAITHDEMTREQHSFIFNATRAFGRNIRNRYCKRNPVFEDIDVSYDPETMRFSMRFKTDREFKVGNPTFKIEGTVNLVWAHGGGHGTRVWVTLDRGLRLNGAAAEPVDIARRSDASVDVMNMIMASGFVKGGQAAIQTDPEAAAHFNVRAARRVEHNTRRMIGLGNGRGDRPRRDSKAQIRHKIMTGTYPV